MTKEEILAIVGLLDREEQTRWMIDLGYHFTVSARDSYPFQEQLGNVTALQGFNELQHAVYGRVRHLGCDEEWTVESFLDRLIEVCRIYRMEGGVGWAINRSLERFL